MSFFLIQSSSTSFCCNGSHCLFLGFSFDFAPKIFIFPDQNKSAAVSLTFL
ncbi:unnamed protein product [Brassica oleracea var. botrytis]|uniref:(rape) hypothetical protein n=1 Tax=Brassica napus TaxID=3708 RepID=A0A816KYE5_BRANA|nr:unnamed protein product [Brassica napus]